MAEVGELRSQGKKVTTKKGIINAAEFWGKQSGMGKDTIQVTKTGICCGCGWGTKVTGGKTSTNTKEDG